MLAQEPPSDDQRVIACFSTLPGRIQGLMPTINSLLDQTRPPDEIVIAVPRYSLREKREYVVPGYLRKIPRVRVLHCDKDWGPATKFIPVLKEEMAAGRLDTLVVVVDDDAVSPPDTIELYLHHHRHLPDAALSFRGWPMARSFRWGEVSPVFGTDVRQPVRVAVITGCGSYLIQPRFFDERLWDYSAAPAGAFYMDDVWISGWLDRRDVAKYVVPASSKPRPVLRQFPTMSLDRVPNGRRQNNDEVIAHFRDTWNVFPET